MKNLLQLWPSSHDAFCFRSLCSQKWHIRIDPLIAPWAEQQPDSAHQSGCGAGTWPTKLRSHDVPWRMKDAVADFIFTCSRCSRSLGHWSQQSPPLSTPSFKRKKHVCQWGNLPHWPPVIHYTWARRKVKCCPDFCPRCLQQPKNAWLLLPWLPNQPRDCQFCWLECSQGNIK